MIRVALADDQPLLLASFATLIGATGDMCVAGTACCRYWVESCCCAASTCGR